MADEKYKNEDPEEENDNQFDDDEDFGLPDLEYDELDDDEDPDLEDDPDITDDPVMEEVSDSKEPEEESGADEESNEVVGAEEFHEDEINVEDIDDGEAEEWEKELEKELEEELKAEEAGGFYEEESYEDFETSGDEAIKNSVFSSDDTDSDDFEASGVEDGSQYVENAAVAGASNSFRGGGIGTSYQSSYQNDNPSKGKFARTVVIGTLAFAVIAVFLYFLWDSTGGAGEPERPVAKKEEQTPPPKQEEPVRQEPEPVQEESTPPARTQQPSQPNSVTPGEITLLEQQTGKSYVVIGSFFDGDMANDYAKELASEGKSPMVIPPFKDHRYYRVAIAEFNSFQDAQASIDGYRNEYGQEVWPLRY